MNAILAWATGAVAAGAVAILVVRPHPPRRFPEDECDDRSDSGGRPAVRGRTRIPMAGVAALLAARPWRPAATSPPLRSRGGGSGSRRRVRGRPSDRRSGTADGGDGELTDLAACCDLLAVAAASGSTVSGSIVAVGSVGHGPVARALALAAESIDRGGPVLDAIGVLRRELGPGGQPLVTTLATAAGSGSPPAPALQRLADAERRRARRRVEARVRRLPVLLLLPLVGLILPAFVLLTLVPVALSAARGAGLAAPVRPGWAAAPAVPPLPPSDPSSTSGGPP